MEKSGPRWVDDILEWRGTWFLARLGLTSAYILGGLTKLSDLPAAVAEQAHFGLTPSWLWASLAIAVEIGGSILVVTGRFVWFGAGALGVLTAVATYVANDFWNMRDQARVMMTNTFSEHLGLIAGFVMVALIAEREKRSIGN
jgi:uncharacterized membrane protein YphA (DoxX/SURF4 family)